MDSVALRIVFKARAGNRPVPHIWALIFGREEALGKCSRPLEEIEFKRPSTGLASLMKIRKFLQYSFKGNIFQRTGLHPALYLIFGPSCLVGMGTLTCKVDPQEEFGLHDH